MRHLAAYLLLVVGGNATPTAEDVTTLLGTAGIEVDSDRLQTLITDLEGKSLAELATLGRDKLYVGGGGVASGSAPSAAPAGGAAAPVVEKKEEKPKEEEVDALDGGMDMFGGSGGGSDY
eukprot:CAMPEP_0196765488 /NCGR_PEP_ID=MMETSP1095-20130614/9383_1 /TAXON_ID=96789 ORGANISM="Chromulina nebulosa, Strain UTEXLB2642" /NCGR_SAMPLE_ID=MMETSP1095 /ASSEMBLY_ACC=CAM_ASM_000446 /LENGTH=119 /DNA_ID=CAMNT_0042123615 /DNA_START=73 /DNA_END=432 /DNA_ORIENTATION=-